MYTIQLSYASSFTSKSPTPENSVGNFIISLTIHKK